jgi:hypothetical protein
MRLRDLSRSQNQKLHRINRRDSRAFYGGRIPIWGVITLALGLRTATGAAADSIGGR